MAKKIRIVLTLQLPAGAATPAPPVGTALGPHGINIVEFCKTYNERTAAQAGQIIPAQLTIFEEGSGMTGRESVGRVTRDQLREIATIKMSDLNANDLEAAAKQVEGTARSMGIEVSN